MIRAYSYAARYVAMLLFFLSLSVSPASASNADRGYISSRYGISNGAVLFSTSGSWSSAPVCQTAAAGAARYALDGSTVVGQAQIATFINAFNTHKKILIIGKGSCTIRPDTETVDRFLLQD